MSNYFNSAPGAPSNFIEGFLDKLIVAKLLENFAGRVKQL